MGLIGATKGMCETVTGTVGMAVDSDESAKDKSSPQVKLPETLELQGAMEALKVATTEHESDKASTASEQRVCHTLEDAIWKENAKDFLIVSDEVLSMPDCTLMIRSLSDREIEIHVDPKKQSAPRVDAKDIAKEEDQLGKDLNEEVVPKKLRGATDEHAELSLSESDKPGSRLDDNIVHKESMP